VNGDPGNVERESEHEDWTETKPPALPPRGEQRGPGDDRLSHRPGSGGVEGRAPSQSFEHEHDDGAAGQHEVRVREQLAQ
jgi:hypothetical protein